MKRILTLIFTTFIVLLILSCDNATTSSDQNSINFENYSPPSTRFIQKGSEFTEYNSDGFPSKFTSENPWNDFYEIYQFNEEGLRTGSLIYRPDVVSGNYENQEYSKIINDADGNEIKKSFHSSSDDSLIRYVETSYTNGAIRVYENYNESNELQNSIEFDSLGRVIKISGITIYWDTILTFQNSIDPNKKFNLDFTYFYETNLPLTVKLTEENSSISFLLTYVIDKGKYKSGELVDENGRQISKMFFEEPFLDGSNLIQEVTAYHVNSPRGNYLNISFGNEVSIRRAIKMTSDYQFLGSINTQTVIESGTVNNKCIPSLFNR